MRTKQIEYLQLFYANTADFYSIFLSKPQMPNVTPLLSSTITNTIKPSVTYSWKGKEFSHVTSVTFDFGNLFQEQKFNV